MLVRCIPIGIGRNFREVDREGNRLKIFRHDLHNLRLSAVDKLGYKSKNSCFVAKCDYFSLNAPEGLPNFKDVQLIIFSKILLQVFLKVTFSTKRADFLPE